MPVVIEQRFPLGRFHGRRWNQPPFDPNSIEWPPSPWRLVRALAARWFQYEREVGDADSTVRNSLLEKLSVAQPAFYLPSISTRCELRQYQPAALEMQFKYKKDSKTKKNVLDYSYRAVTTTLVPDLFCALAPTEPLLWVWKSTVLETQERALLAELLRRMHYFGRAESWTRMRLCGEDERVPQANVTLEAKSSLATLPVLVNASADGVIDRLLKLTGDKYQANRSIPLKTAWHHAKAQGRRDRRAAQALRPQACSAALARIQVVRYALDSTVLPLVTETLPLAEAARRALKLIYGRMTKRNSIHGHSPVFSGKDEHGRPLSGHGHAYYLPTDEDDDRRIDHLTVFARSGFDDVERRALDQLRKLNTGRKGEERHPLRLLLLGMGMLKEYAPGPLRTSQVWVSATPYIATRHAKTRGRDRIDVASTEARVAFLAADLREQLKVMLPDISAYAADIKIKPLLDGGAFKVAERWRPIQFKRFRGKPSDDGGRRMAGAFRIEFPQPVDGPIVLGHSSHFGMGLFVPEDRPVVEEGPC